MSPDDVIEHPAYQALRRHAMTCLLCVEGAKCLTGNTLTETLRDAQGEGGATVSR